MGAILEVTVPFFALVLAGYMAGRRHVLPESAIPGLNAFVLYFALPCLLFRFGASTPIFDLLNPAVLGTWLLAAGLIVFLTISTSLNERVGLKDAAFGALVASFPNTGFMGVPLLVALMGPAAAGPVICIVLADLFVTSSLCIAIAQAHEASGHGSRTAALRALRGALSNPLPWSIALGAVFSLTGMTLPGPVDSIVRMLADASTPVALIKLFVHPLLVFALAAALHVLGAPISKFQIAVLTLGAALPSASNVSLLAERYQADNGRIARIILASTALAFVTFSTVAWVFGAGVK
jgi:predicted permease